MIFAVFVFLLLLCIIFPKSKMVAGGVFLFMWQLWGWNTWNGDYFQYEYIYNTLGKFGLDALNVEIGYNIFNHWIYSLGFDFQGFMIIYSFVILGLIMYFTNKSPYPAVFAILYFIIFIMDYVFMRNYMANVLFFVFLALLFKNPKYLIVKSLIVLLLALAFHNTGIFYFAFLLVLRNKLSIKKLSILVMGIVLVLSTSMTLFISLINSEFLAGKIKYYATGDSPIGPAMSHGIIVLALLLFIHFTKKQQLLLSPEKNRVITLFQKINIITLIYIPLYFFIPDFGRFFRVLFPLELFLILYLFYSYKKINLRVILGLILIGMYSIVLYQFAFSTLKLTYYPLIESNLIYSSP
ncbi:EpsG family protein [Chryseobacterium sp. MYb328]|uniref:EpsG family protein n=1 Tax=Chryseobacterium sp. MYb328 TaxID=2745231 RepID=UPI0030A30077